EGESAPGTPPASNPTPPATPTSYTVSVSASPAAAGTVSGNGMFAAGNSDTVKATANAGYAFANWTENGTVVSTSASYSFTGSARRTLGANFAANQPSYTILLSPPPSASGAVSGGRRFVSGNTVTVTASPASGFNFTNWTENGTTVSTSASYSFTATANRTLVANFAASVSGGTMGDTTVYPATDSDNANLLLVQDATLSRAGVLRTMSFYVVNPAGSLQLGLYDATGSGGGPGKLLAQSSTFKPVKGWNTTSVLTTVALPAGKYWLAYSPSSNNLSFAVERNTGRFMGVSNKAGSMP